MNQAKLLMEDEDSLIEKTLEHKTPRILMSMGFGFIELKKRKIDVIAVSPYWFRLIKKWTKGFEKKRIKVNLKKRVIETSGFLWDSPVVIMSEFNKSIATLISEGDEEEEIKHIVINLKLLEKEEECKDEDEKESSN